MSGFNKDPKSPNGLSYLCSQCGSIISRNWYRNNLEKVLKYRQENRDKIKAYQKKYYQDNKSNLNIKKS